MTVFALSFPKLFELDRPARPRPEPKETWPLMGDVSGCRAGVPEVLIQWRRAKGQPDPEPKDRLTK